MAASETGPFLIAALFCEHYLRDQDGLESYLRIVDRVAVPAPVDAEHAAPEVALTFVLNFKAGEARGSLPVTLRTQLPSGAKATERTTTVFFESEDRGATITLPIRLEAREPGVYWFEVLVENELMTKAPLRIVFEERGEATER